MNTWTKGIMWVTILHDICHRYISVCPHRHVCIHTHTYLHTHVHTHACACTCICALCTHMRTHLHGSTYTHRHAHTTQFFYRNNKASLGFSSREMQPGRHRRAVCLALPHQRAHFTSTPASRALATLCLSLTFINDPW